jgi:hypothetical protein
LFQTEANRSILRTDCRSRFGIEELWFISAVLGKSETVLVEIKGKQSSTSEYLDLDFVQSRSVQTHSWFKKESPGEPPGLLERLKCRINTS